MKFPGWLSWLFVLFLGYMLYAGYNPLRPTPEDVPETAPVTQAPSPDTDDFGTLRAFIDGKRWAKALNPNYTITTPPCELPSPEQNQLPRYYIIHEAGTGEPARCGEKILLDFKLWNPDGTGQERQFAQPITLGEQPILDALLVGLKAGESRTLFFTTPAEPYKANILKDMPTGKLIAMTVMRSAATPKSE